jgi:hypothetical protein
MPALKPGQTVALTSCRAWQDGNRGKPLIVVDAQQGSDS